MAPRKRKAAGSLNIGSGDLLKRARLEQKTVQLLDLPLGPLHLIISKVNPSKQKILRCASPQLKLEHSDCIMHKYKSFANLYLSAPCDSDEQMMVQSVMQVLAQSTDYFINSGYDAIFTSMLLHFYKQFTTGEEAIDVTQMHRFLHEFYNNLEWSPSEWPSGDAARMRLNQRRLIHTMTLLNLLRQFQKFRIVSSGMNLLHWHLQLEVLGIYFGVHDKQIVVTEEEKLVDFLTIIAELLVFDKSNKYASRFTEIGNSAYLYGLRRPSLSPRCPKLTLNFSVLAPLPLRALLEDVLKGKVNMAEAVRCPLMSVFSIQLAVKCRQVNMCGGNNCIDICIVPLN